MTKLFLFCFLSTAICCAQTEPSPQAGQTSPAPQATPQPTPAAPPAETPAEPAPAMAAPPQATAPPAQPTAPPPEGTAPAAQPTPPPENVAPPVQPPAPPPPNVQAQPALPPPQAAVQPLINATNLVEKGDVPTDSDMYCAGFISKEVLPSRITVAGGFHTPNLTRFAGSSMVYLTGGEFKEGDRFSIIRHIQDPNRFETYRGKRKTVDETGEVYSELGILRIVSVKAGIGVAQIDLSCAEFTLGDIAIPFVERKPPIIRHNITLDPLTSPNGKLTGRIVLGREFDSIIGMRRIIYLNVGSDQGVKVGDYFRATRTYEAAAKEEATATIYKALTGEPQQKLEKGSKPQYRRIKLTGPDSSGMVEGFPRVTLADMIVLNALPHTSTAMVMDVLGAVEPGDMVELMEEPAAPIAESPVAGPSITCTSNPLSGSAGASFTITCNGVSPDERPLTYAFETTKGRLTPRDSIATLTTRDVAPGPINIKTTVMDDRNLSASTITTVTIDAPPPSLTPSLLNSIFFKPGSARVDNAAKAVLDGVALQMQRDTSTSVVIIGFTNPEENPKLARQRADNAKTYLTTEKGVDAGRVQTREGGQNGTKAEIWLLPAGTSLP